MSDCASSAVIESILGGIVVKGSKARDGERERERERERMKGEIV